MSSRMPAFRLASALLTVTVVVPGTLASCSAPSPESDRPDVLVLVVDGLRADASDEWLAAASLDDWLGGEAVTIYDRAYAPSSLGAQSLAAFFSGRYPTHGGGIGLAEAQPSQRAVTLATRFRRAGYRTGFVSQAPWAARPGYTRGFDDLQVPAAELAGADGWSVAKVTELALRIVDDWKTLAAREDGDEGRPSFLVVHWAPAGLEGAGPEATELQAWLAEVGTAVAALRTGLQERGELVDDLVAFTSGHGVERGEHGGTGTGWTLHEEVVRVPLRLRGLAAAATEPVAGPVSTLALGATLRAVVATSPEGAETASTPFQPRSLPGLAMAGEAGGRAPVLAELVVRERAIARAVIDGDLKYLRVLRETPIEDRAVVARGYEELQSAIASGSVPVPPLFGEAVRELLARVERDAVGETELALEEHREELSRLRALLRDYRRLCEEGGWAPPEITERLPVDPEDAEQLEMLGYL